MAPREVPAGDWVEDSVAALRLAAWYLAASLALTVLALLAVSLLVQEQPARGVAVFPATSDPHLGRLVARVRAVELPQLSPAQPCVSDPNRRVGPVTGAEVWVFSQAEPQVLAAREWTDRSGEARFLLAPGDYWVGVPAGDLPGYPGVHTAIGTLPSGQAVIAGGGVRVERPDGAPESAIRLDIEFYRQVCIGPLELVVAE